MPRISRRELDEADLSCEAIATLLTRVLREAGAGGSKSLRELRARATEFGVTYRNSVNWSKGFSRMMWATLLDVEYIPRHQGPLV